LFFPLFQSVLNIQLAYAKALLVEGNALRKVQEEKSVLGAYVVQNSYCCIVK
jgi:L-rhamnose isomerase